MQNTWRFREATLSNEVLEVAAVGMQTCLNATGRAAERVAKVRLALSTAVCASQTGVLCFLSVFPCFR